MSFFKRRGGNSLNSPASANSPNKSSPSTAATSTAQVESTGTLNGLDSLPQQGDGSDKFFGMENFGYTCYCNSVLQCLYYSKPFRDAIINYPPANTRQPRQRRASVPGANPHPFLVALKQQAEKQAAENAKTAKDKKTGTKSKRANSVISALSSNGSGSGGPPASPGTIFSNGTISNVNGTAGGGAESASISNSLPLRGDESTTPEQKKKAALTNGPIINMDHSMNQYYNMEESLFTTLKDIFEAMVEHRSRTGIVSPAKLIEVLKRQNELFRSSMHQDAHEFFNFLLNEIVDNVEQHECKLRAQNNDDQVSNTRWVHELFEGLLTSETKCLTCENVSRRDEMFLDLSIDLEQHTSVTSCLRQFSASEMLCESNKFHCDCCGGLQEAEKRMKINRLPRILALHLKRFKFTEDMQRNVKLFHKVMFPYHLRLFNTTDDVQDPDRLYELYAVVVHIGGGPYHGHYVSIVKTEHTGWVLFDDEMVERVDDDYVTNFFGDKPGLACAYILFYQEISGEEYERARRYGAAAASSASLTPVKQATPIVVSSPFLAAPQGSTLATSPSSTTTTSASSPPVSSAASSTSSIAQQVPPSAADSHTKLMNGKLTRNGTPTPSLVTSSPTPAAAATNSNGADYGTVKSKKEGGSGGLSRLKSTSISQKQKFWKRDSSTASSDTVKKR
ncbi:hypothetical protein POJ06DRAFT_256809 [Lipomyces tetrasporus]|uniref:ubiquitinyl hydrolase 1 n=1 Tax=Lipomyces tetrasporus TaxID=54092 RepID=A0AAD7QQ19_9ASCO|nr:uncharacterized protein POJ06DRAFT_256809 [Lipomyces tetrasporus]KAJ8099379.1 hypothetical protein POJ06DRAFT_256809 [Lipomyces tetrasporus]